MVIKKTKYGTWQARWRDDAGKQRSQNFPLKRDAENHLNNVLADLSRGTYVAPTAGTTKVKDWADQWLASAMNLGQGGRDTYRRDLDRYILPELGGLALRKVTPGVIDDFLSTELERLAPSTVHRHYRTIRRMMQVAVERGKLPKNPCDTVTPPHVAHTEMLFLDAAQLEQLADAITKRYRAWVFVAGYGGLRWFETVGLRRARVDGPRITVAEQLVRRADKHWHRDAPKTKAGRRTVTMPAFAAEVLEHHLDEYSAPGPDGLVFPNQHGAPMNGPSWRFNVWQPALKRAGLDPALRPHDLRHTAVALSIAAGAHPKAIQARMGHASITITLDRYGHLFPEMDEQIAVELDTIRTLALDPKRRLTVVS